MHSIKKVVKNSIGQISRLERPIHFKQNYVFVSKNNPYGLKEVTEYKSAPTYSIKLERPIHYRNQINSLENIKLEKPIHYRNQIKSLGKKNLERPIHFKIN